MDLVLQRHEYRRDGVFGSLLSATGFRCATLEHAYALNGKGFYPKIPAGKYVCERGMHRLEHMTSHFETFQILNVPNHTNCLFHVGNFNNDSDGCVLVGRSVVMGAHDGIQVISHSQDTFKEFMFIQSGSNRFGLIVNDYLP